MSPPTWCTCAPTIRRWRAQRVGCSPRRCGSGERPGRGTCPMGRRRCGCVTPQRYQCACSGSASSLELTLAGGRLGDDRLRDAHARRTRRTPGSATACKSEAQARRRAIPWSRCALGAALGARPAARRRDALVWRRGRSEADGHTRHKRQQLLFATSGSCARHARPERGFLTGPLPRDACRMAGMYRTAGRFRTIIVRRCEIAEDLPGVVQGPRLRGASGTRVAPVGLRGQDASHCLRDRDGVGHQPVQGRNAPVLSERRASTTQSRSWRLWIGY